MASAHAHEDGFGNARRGEATSRLETRLDGEQEQEQKPRFESSVHEGLHAEDCPQLMGSIKAAQKVGQEDAAAADDLRSKEYLAASSDGSVRRMPGDPDVRAIAPTPGEGDNYFDQLKKKRLASMRQQAAQRQAWLELGHGVYATLPSEAGFLQELPKHDRAVCHLFDTSLDCELLHHHMRALSEVHLETYFCRLDVELAPTMMAMVSLREMPALLLCMGGRVTGQLTGIDRSFTSEGVAYELAQTGMLDFEDGTRYARTTGGCTTETAASGGGGGGGGISDHDSDDLSD